MSDQLQGRRILITGGSAGIGRATASACVAEGAKVACLARDEARLSAVTQEIGALGIAADVLDEGAVQAAIERVVGEFGGLDALVNNAGYSRPGGVGETSLDDWRRMFDVNVLGLLNVTRAAMPALCAEGLADVVNLSSMGGRRVARAESGIYSGTKFAVHALSEGLRRELHEHGVRVAVVAPGSVATEFGLEHATPGEIEQKMERRARIGLSPDHVAAQVVHVLAQPPEVMIQEIALTSRSQVPR